MKTFGADKSALTSRKRLLSAYPKTTLTSNQPKVALYSCSISNIKRSDGRSSVAKAAYNSRSLLLDERTANQYNYSQKSDLGFSEIITPENAPFWTSDRQQLWSKNELANKRRDARVAKEILVALPRELDKSQQQKLIRSFVANNLTTLGVVADVNAHELDQSDHSDWNPHVHILISTQHLVDGEFGSKITELNKKDFVTKIREAWAEQTNLALSAAGEVERVDHRSNQARGIERTPQIHLGHKAWAMKQKGIATERGDRFSEIEERNQEIDTITAQVRAAIKQSQIATLQTTTVFPQPVVTSSPVTELQKKPWWRKATDFIFGSASESNQPKTEKPTPTAFSGNVIQQLAISDQLQYSPSNQTHEQKQELALVLVKQIENQRSINQRLRTMRGKLVVLRDSDQVRVLSLKFGGDKSQQEKLIIRQSETGWKITKYQLSDEQRQTLLKVLKSVDSISSIFSSVITAFCR
ncbi:MAG: MobQ family relaxase [Cyanobacteria bacterium J06621_12]